MSGQKYTAKNEITDDETRSEDGFQMPNSRKKKRLTLMSHQEKKPKLTRPTVTDNDTSNPPSKNQPLSRQWLTPTPSTSEAAKPANFKTPKQPVPKLSAKTTESTVNTRKRNFPDQKSTNSATDICHNTYLQFNVGKPNEATQFLS
ncbi:hypothetical protein GWI33_000053 [Rhynchophorus ferrugineus]|uniref:Uncharacterized protein n=1 Tax=Rhynchophorus ferrugineus TaxID=354439 RepID=A0A834J0L3_RHYFE|nr:hypothetical protein GWI33_000053 [Rhynchophorus ferrugineus]